MRTRGPKVWGVVFLLWLSVIGSSFAVVLSTYQVRTQINHLEQLRDDASELRVLWGRYLLEQSTWGSYKRVETLAIERLQMQVPESEQVKIIIDDRR